MRIERFVDVVLMRVLNVKELSLSKHVLSKEAGFSPADKRDENKNTNTRLLFQKAPVILYSN